MMLTLGVSITSITSFVTDTLMRYIPQSRYSFDEICKQCFDAINRPPSVKKVSTVPYNEVQRFFAKWEELSTAR